MGDFNFEAANQGAVAVPNAVNASIDAWDKINQNARVADMMVKANPDLVQRMGFQSPAQFSNLSAQDKIAATTGYIKQQGVQEMAARMQDWQAQAQQRTAQATQLSQDSDSLSNYAQMLDQQVNQPDPKDAKATAFAASIPDGVKFQIHAAAAAGKTNPRTAAAMIKPMMDYFGPQGQGAAPVKPKLTVLPVGDPEDPDYHEIPVIQDGKGNQMVDPAYVEQQKAKLAKQAQEAAAKIQTMKGSTVKIKLANPDDPLNPTELELPIDEAEKRGYIKAAGGATAGGAAGKAAPAAAPAGPTATNPKTGQKLIYQNGQWTPLQ